MLIRFFALPFVSVLDSIQPRIKLLEAIMNNTEVMVDVSEASAQSASKKTYVAPTGPQDLSLRATEAGTQFAVDGLATSTTS